MDNLLLVILGFNPAKKVKNIHKSSKMQTPNLRTLQDFLSCLVFVSNHDANDIITFL